MPQPRRMQEHGCGKLPGVHAGGNGRDCSNGSLQKAKTRL